MKTFIIYSDESIKDGKYFHNFYGGALVSGNDYNNIVSILENKKQSLDLNGEIKWSQTSATYLEKYKEFIKTYFELIKQNKIKIRIMFSQCCYKAIGLTQKQKEDEFFLLYYQFLKNAFGLEYCNLTGEDIYLKTYFDKLPDTRLRKDKFKDFIFRLQYNSNFKESNIKIRKEDVTDINSRKHVILQGMDVIMGSMQFRLNDCNKAKDPKTGKRGKKTIAKEKLYKYINSLINEIYPGFNIGISTGKQGAAENIWKHPYRHWLFIPNHHVITSGKTKHK